MKAYSKKSESLASPHTEYCDSISIYSQISSLEFESMVLERVSSF